MKKQSKPELRQTCHDMVMQKKLETSKTKSKRHKILHGGMKLGITKQMLVHRCSRQTASFRRAVERSIAATKKNGNPVAKYDVQRRQAYLEYPDGTRVYVE